MRPGLSWLMAIDPDYLDENELRDLAHTLKLVRQLTDGKKRVIP